MNSLRSASTANAALGSVFRNPAEFLRRGWLPAAVDSVVSAGTTLLLLQFLAEAAAARSTADLVWLSRAGLVVNLFVVLLVFVPFSYSWFRFVLVPGETFRLRDALPGRRHVRFVLHFCVLAVLGYGAFTVIMLGIGEVLPARADGLRRILLVAIAACLIAAILLRLSAPLAAAALGKSIGYAESWKAGRGGFLPLVGLVLLLALPTVFGAIALTFLSGQLMGSLLGGEDPGTAVRTLIVLQAPVNAVFVMAFIAVASAAIAGVFRHSAAGNVRTPPAHQRSG